MVVVDMPFMSYQTSVYDAVMNAGRLMKEGRAKRCKTGRWSCCCRTDKGNYGSGYPGYGHILGLTPQSINAFGG